ncbi:MAG TPA: substrate-binding domain-containing protein [Candidatus Kapabacteria bacterium]|jgi:phosphate transport system substrate-binding protein|nr:substrate-binding domain-containing protein [Candidatus Kapabacteria bacterium]
MKLRSAFTIALLIGATLTGCSKSSQNPPSETATSGTFQLVADEALKPVVDSLLDGFMKENPNAKLTVKYVSAAEAVRELLNRDARAVIIDRTLTPEERAVIQKDSVQLPEFTIAEDGIGCIVSNKNPLAALALSDLRKIITNETKNWPALTRSIPDPGKTFTNADISFVFPAYPSSMEYIIDSMFLGAGQVTQGHIRRFSTTDSVIAYVRLDPNAIGFIGSAWNHQLESSGDSSVKVLPIIPADSSSLGITQPIILNMVYVYQGLYPLTTTVTGYSFESPNTLPRGFLAYAMTAHGQIIFKNFDVLPKTQIIRIVPPK